MANYAIRVELRGNPTVDKYETLHALMAQYGFHQKISGVSTDGAQGVFDLPHAVYYGASNGNCQSIRDALVAAIKARVQQAILVFVVEAAMWAIG